MNSSGLLVKDVPLPYFVLDQKLKVLKKSNVVEASFQVGDSFLELIDEKYRQDMLVYLWDSDQTGAIEILMYEKNKTKRFYQVIKTTDNIGNYHVFCLSLKTHLVDVNLMLTSVENKMIELNKNMNEKKHYIEQKVEELKLAANTFERHNNIEKLAAGIAHEIRNPLTTVKGFLQLLRPYLKEIGKVQYADVALEEINRANNIIFEFLNATKPDQNPAYGITLNKLVKDIVMLYESEAILRDIEINTSFSTVDHVLQMDSNQLKQVLINLIKNAMEAIDEGEKVERFIHISTNVSVNYMNIHISDSGCGMSDDTKKLLFTPFFSTKETGTGIGLSLCKKMVEENGGTISLKSTYGQGTTFTLSFPIKTAVSSLNA